MFSLDNSKIRRLSIVALTALWVAGCAHQGKITTIEKPDESLKLARIMILPFQDLPDGSLPIIDGYPRWPRASAARTWIPSEAGVIIEEIFRTHLSRQKYFTIEDRLQEDIHRRLIRGELFREDTQELLKSLGREADVDGIIVGFVYRYRERKGRAWAVERAASVAFEINLIKTGDGSLIWKGYYDKTQKSLLENLLDISSFIKQRGRWLTARELADEGVRLFVKKITSTD